MKRIFFYFLLFLTVSTMVIGCATQKKAEKFYDKHPEKLADKCATEFPVKDSIIKGDSVVLFDTLWETFTDTLISEPQVVTEIKTVPKIVTKWVTIRDTIIRENTARVAVLGSQIAKLNEANRKLVESNADLSQKLVRISDERDTFKHERNNARLLNWILILAIGLGIGLAIRKKLKIW